MRRADIKRYSGKVAIGVLTLKGVPADPCPCLVQAELPNVEFGVKNLCPGEALGVPRLAKDRSVS